MALDHLVSARLHCAHALESPSFERQDMHSICSGTLWEDAQWRESCPVNFNRSLSVNNLLHEGVTLLLSIGT